MNLRALFHRHFPVFKTDLTNNNNRRIADKHGLTKVRAVVIPCVQFNPDTGEIINWGVWTQDQDFQGNVNIDGTLAVGGVVTLAEEIVLTMQAAAPAPILGQVVFYVVNVAGVPTLCCIDEDGNITEMSGILASFPSEITVDGDIHTTSAGDIHAAGNLESDDDVIVGDDIVMGSGQRIYFDDNLDTYLRIADDQIWFYTGGTWRLLISNDAVNYGRSMNMNGYPLVDTSRVELDEVAAPAARAAHVRLYAKAKGESNSLYFRTDDGVEHEVATV